MIRARRARMRLPLVVRAVLAIALSIVWLACVVKGAFALDVALKGVWTTPNALMFALLALLLSLGFLIDVMARVGVALIRRVPPYRGVLGRERP